MSPEEFASAAALAVWQPEICKSARKHPDPYLESALKSAGIKDEQIPLIATSMNRSFVTTDMFIQTPRGNAGRFYKTTVNAGRKEAVEAFRAYADGDAAKLSKLLGEGVNMVAKDLRLLDAGQISAQLRGSLAIGAQALGLLERDPKLMAAAVDAGMDLKHLQTLQSARKLIEMDKAAASAACQLKDAADGTKKLLSNQKKELLKTVLKQKIACAMIARENLNGSAEYNAINGNLLANTKNPKSAQQQLWAAHPELRESPGEGKIWFDSYTQVWAGLKNELLNTPKSVDNLPNQGYQKHLDQLTDQIIAQHQLGQKSEKELYKTLTASGDALRLSDSIAKAEEALRNPGKRQSAPQPQPQPQVQRQAQNLAQNSVLSRAKMFEQPSQGGLGKV